MHVENLQKDSIIVVTRQRKNMLDMSDIMQMQQGEELSDNRFSIEGSRVGMPYIVKSVYPPFICATDVLENPTILDTRKLELMEGDEEYANSLKEALQKQRNKNPLMQAFRDGNEE